MRPRVETAEHTRDLDYCRALSRLFPLHITCAGARAHTREKKLIRNANCCGSSRQYVWARGASEAPRPRRPRWPVSRPGPEVRVSGPTRLTTPRAAIGTSRRISTRDPTGSTTQLRHSLFSLSEFSGSPAPRRQSHVDRPVRSTV